MIIGISGKKQHGKDLVANIIQWLTFKQLFTAPDWTYENFTELNKTKNLSEWEIKRFADKLKDMVCILIGCTRKQLENDKFKNTSLGEEWTRYAYADGHNDHYRNGEWTKSMNSVFCSKEKYEEEYRINWQTAYKSELTPRLLLQTFGTNCGRDIIHSNVWVNATMSDYKSIGRSSKYAYRFGNGWRYFENVKVSPDLWNKDVLYPETNAFFFDIFPDWIIPDVRFPNEVETVEKKNGIVYRIERPSVISTDLHESETALDNHNFGERIITNNGSIESLIAAVEFALRRDKILPDA